LSTTPAGNSLEGAPHLPKHLLVVRGQSDSVAMVALEADVTLHPLMDDAQVDLGADAMAGLLA
jgi:hypothetical protein